MIVKPKKSAYEAAQKLCSGTASSPEKYDENRHVNDATDDSTDYILEAANSWWAEILNTEENLYNSTVNANFANVRQTWLHFVNVEFKSAIS
ncbi:hypothetical protein ANCCAN_26338 [Ancylostoma caninum]|uniref:SCP domain-containing protein n=1 Tax=Ancylostoma caninum TaxID=29170 RepID=A0A368FAS4_ANCCA|nr:hypothetical protein ANCCAN_26338 [Ancylostoma caninum]